jgi:hypothetical protein
MSSINMKSVCIYASDLAVVIGVNKYQKLSETIIKLWQKSFPIDYENTVSNLKKQHSVNLTPKETDIQYIKRIQDECNINLQDKVNECLNTKDTSKLLNNRNQILKEIDKNNTLDPEIKRDFKKSLESVTNKAFGTINEKSVIEHYMSKSGKKVICDSKFIRKELCTYKDIKWSLGGKIDGITEDNIVIEVKNRIYKLFYEMRDYEKPQIQTYMYILGLPKGHLVESFKRGGDIQMNIIEEDFDQEYWTTVIMSRLTNFIKMFHLFLNNVDLKTYILLGEGEEKEEILRNFLSS